MGLYMDNHGDYYDSDCEECQDGVWLRDEDLLFILKDGTNHKTIRCEGMSEDEVIALKGWLRQGFHLF